MKKFFTKEVTIALAVIVSGVVLVSGIDFLKGHNIFTPNNYYTISYPSVNGLTISTPVLVNGYKVGIVQDMKFDYETMGNVEVVVSLDDQLKVPTGSKALLVVDFLGVANIDLKIANHQASYHNSGDAIEGVVATGIMGELEEEILPQMKEMLPKVNSILDGLDKLVNNTAIEKSLGKMENITTQLEVSTIELTRLMQSDVPSVMNSVANITNKLDTFSTQLATIDINQTMALVDETLRNLELISERLNSTDNSMGLLLNNQELYYGLTNTVNSIDSLVIDLKQNPKRYVHFSIW